MHKRWQIKLCNIYNFRTAHRIKYVHRCLISIPQMVAFIAIVAHKLYAARAQVVGCVFDRVMCVCVCASVSPVLILK